MTIVLRAQITIDLQAEDFVRAADHQRRIESLMGAIRDVYQEAALEFRERRPRPARTLGERRPIRHYTGVVAEYEDQ